MALITDHAADQRIAEIINREFLAADEVRQHFDWEWDEAIDFYMQLMQMDMPEGAEWFSAELLNEFFISIESVLPQLVSRLYENPRSFSLESAALDGTRVQRNAEAAVRIQRNRADFAPRSIPFLRMALITGHQGFKNYWLREIGQKMVPVWGNPELNADGAPVSRIIKHEVLDHYSHNGPWTEFCDMKRVWKSASKDWRGRPLATIEEIPYDLGYMKYMQRRFKDMTGDELYNQDALDSLTGQRNSQHLTQHISRTRSASGGRISMWERSTVSTTSGASDETLNGKDAVALIQWFGYIPPEEDGGKDYDDSQWRMILLTPNGKRLRDEVIPTHDLRSPHREIALLRVGGEPYGRSPMRWSKKDIEEMSQLRNLRIADVWANVVGTWVAAEDAGFDNLEWLRYPGAVMTYNDSRGRPWNQVLGVVPRQQQTQDVWLEQQDMAARIQRANASDPNTMGQAYGSRTPATESMIIDKKHGARLDMMQNMLAWQLEQTSMDDYYHLMQMYQEEPIIVGFDDRRQPIAVTGASLDFPAEVTVDAGVFGSMNEFQLRAITQGMGAMFSDPEMAMWQKKDELSQEYWWRLGFQNVDRIMKSQEEFDRDIQAQREHEMAVAQAEAQGRGGAR